MKRLLPLAALLITLVGLPASADYDELRRDVEAYAPPAHLMVPATNDAAEAPEREATVPAKEAVAAARDAYNASLATADTFYRPDGALAARVEKHGHKLLADRFDLMTLEALVYARHAGVAAARVRYEASLEAFRQIDALDEILRGYTVLTETVMTGVGPMKGKDPVQMKFPFPGVTALKGRVAAEAAASARASAEIAVRDALTEAQTAFWELRYALRAKAVRREMLTLLERLESVASARYEAGKTSFQDVVQLRVRRETLAEALVTLDEMADTLRAKLKRLANLPADAVVGVPADEGFLRLDDRHDEPRLRDAALAHRQELTRMRREIDKMALMIEMAETMVVPPYSLGLSVYADEPLAQSGPGAMKPTFAETPSAAMGVGTPKMAWYGTGDAFLRETRLKLDGMRRGLADMEAMTVVKVRADWFAYDKAQRELALHDRSVVQLSRAALEVAHAGYEAGNVGFADVIGAYAGWFDARLARERLVSDTGTTVAALEATVGMRLESAPARTNDSGPDASREETKR